MGCCSSSVAAAKANMTTHGFYESSPQRTSSKRSYMSRISNGSSSGVYSRCTTPSRRSILSRCSTLTALQKPSANKFDVHRRDTPSQAFSQLSICDDFCDGAKLQNNHQCDLDKSFGYFSESMESTPSKSSLRHTQDTSTEHEDTLYKQASSDLDMEMYMMTHADGLMQKTSSPIFHRRDVTFELPPTTRSASYQKWRNYLQGTPTYMLHNVTNIPEAVAGLFSPADFPAYSDLDDMENAAKRYKVDVHPAPAIGVTNTITTDL